MPKWSGSGTATQFREEKWIESRVLILLAGTAAERHLTGRHNWRGATHDISIAHELAGSLYHGRALKLFFDFMIERRRTPLPSPRRG